MVAVNQGTGRVGPQGWGATAGAAAFFGLCAGIAALAFRRLRADAAAMPGQPYLTRHLGFFFATTLTSASVAGKIPRVGEAPLSILAAAVLVHATFKLPFTLWAGVWAQRAMHRFFGLKVNPKPQ